MVFYLIAKGTQTHLTHISTLYQQKKHQEVDNAEGSGTGDIVFAFFFKKKKKKKTTTMRPYYDTVVRKTDQTYLYYHKQTKNVTTKTPHMYCKQMQ